MENLFLVFQKTAQNVFGKFNLRKRRSVGFNGCSHRYEFKFSGSKFEISSDIPIRNHETIMRAKDKETKCECGQKLETMPVKFAYNGSGRMHCFYVQYCPKCDELPPKTAIMYCLMDGQFFFFN